MPSPETTSDTLVRGLLFALGALLALAGCDREPKWWCQAAPAAAHDRKPQRKCYRLSEYCEGGCEQTAVAHCFDIGRGVPYGSGTLPPRRDCFFDGETCNQAREHRQRRKNDVTSECIGVSD